MSKSIDLFESIQSKLRTTLSPEKRAALRRLCAEPLGLVYRRNLPRLAQIFGSDKWGAHWYCGHYQRHFSPLRTRKLTLLEIGIGGYDDPSAGGQSLRMWRRYFRRARIYGIDITDKSPHDRRRIQTFRGDQSDEDFLRKVVDRIGRPDIVIDDGSHLNDHVVGTFRCLFPLLADDGIYVVEDTETAYWPEYGGSSDGEGSAETSMSFLKGLTDGLNHAEYLRPGYAPTYFDRHIVSMHFYHNLVFVYKGINDEPGNQWAPRFTELSGALGAFLKDSRSRARAQVEAKAIRKLQHPVRACKLEGFLPGGVPR